MPPRYGIPVPVTHEQLRRSLVQRISGHNLERLLDQCLVLQHQGWTLVQPVYVDWFWRGYSIKMLPPKQAFGPMPISPASISD